MGEAEEESVSRQTNLRSTNHIIYLGHAYPHFSHLTHLSLFDSRSLALSIWVLFQRSLEVSNKVHLRSRNVIGQLIG